MHLRLDDLFAKTTVASKPVELISSQSAGVDDFTRRTITCPHLVTAHKRNELGVGQRLSDFISDIVDQKVESRFRTEVSTLVRSVFVESNVFHVMLGRNKRYDRLTSRSSGRKHDSERHERRKHDPHHKIAHSAFLSIVCVY